MGFQVSIEDSLFKNSTSSFQGGAFYMSALNYASVIELRNVEFLDSFSMSGSVLFIEETFDLDSWVHFELVTIAQTFDSLLPTIKTVLLILDNINTMSTISLSGNYWIYISGVSEFNLISSEFSLK